MRDAPLVSARAAGIPKPTHFSPPFPELIPLSVALSTMGIALWCVWAAFTTAEPPEMAVPAPDPPEVAAEAAEPPEVVVSVLDSPEVAAEAAEPPEVAVPVPDSTEVAAYAAKPPEATSFTSALVTVVVPINELTVCPATAMEAVCEL